MTVLRLTGLRLRKLIFNLRFFIGILTIASLFILIQYPNYSKMCSELGIKSTPWTMPFLLELGGVVTLGIVIVLFFCDAPFTEENEMYIIMRTNRVKWLFSKIIYIFAVSVIIILIMFIFSVVYLIPNVGLSADWGDAIRLSQENITVMNDYNVRLGLFPEILDMFSPFTAMLFSCSFFVMASFFIGSLMFTINLYFSRVIGAGVGMFFVLLHGYTKLNIEADTIWVSPITWSGLTQLNYLNSTSYLNKPSAVYALLFIIISCTAMWVVSYYKFNSCDFNTLETI